MQPKTGEIATIAAKEVAELAKPLLGSPIRNLGELIADRVRFWRWKSAANIVRLANEIRQKENLPQYQVSLKVFLPFIEEVSKENEDDAEINNLWARLLATSHDKTTGFDLVCIDILKSVGPLEARLLKKIAQTSDKIRYPSSVLIETKRGKTTTDLSFRYTPREIDHELYVAYREEYNRFKSKLIEQIQTKGTVSYTNFLSDLFFHKLGVLATEILGSPTKQQEEYAYSLTSLSRLKLIATTEIAICDQGLYEALRSVSALDNRRHSEGDNDRAKNIGKGVCLSEFGNLFMKRCAAIDKK